MPSSQFPLRLVDPGFASPLTKTIFQLQELRRLRLLTEIHPRIAAEVQAAFHILETVGSVRIEGNQTTLSEAVEIAIGIDEKNSKTTSERQREVRNIYNALEMIDETIKPKEKISEKFIRELHAVVVDGLPVGPNLGGDETPGSYRTKNVIIQNSKHKPPDFPFVPQMMTDLVKFINEEPEKMPQADLLVTALVHHRFTWIHPFHNGNGRVVRLLTYAMLLQQGYRVSVIINPTAIFCEDRMAYYDALAKADKGTDEGLLYWSSYVLDNLLIQMKKINVLMEKKFFIEKIIDPALASAVQYGDIGSDDAIALRVAFEEGAIRASKFKEKLPAKKAYEISRLIKKLKNKKMLIPIKDGARLYQPQLSSNPLLRGVIGALEREGLVKNPDKGLKES